MPSDGTALAAANGARAGTIIPSSNRLAVMRWSLAKIVEDAAKLLVPFDFQVQLTSCNIRIRNFRLKLPVKPTLVGRKNSSGGMMKARGRESGELFEAAGPVS